jgi:hypothetical protein
LVTGVLGLALLLWGWILRYLGHKAQWERCTRREVSLPVRCVPPLTRCLPTRVLQFPCQPWDLCVPTGAERRQGVSISPRIPPAVTVCRHQSPHIGTVCRCSLCPVWSVNQALSHYGEGQYANVRRITEAFPGQGDPTARNHCRGQWGFGEVKRGCSASDTEPRERDRLGDC